MDDYDDIDPSDVDWRATVTNLQREVARLTKIENRAREVVAGKRLPGASAQAAAGYILEGDW